MKENKQILVGVLGIIAWSLLIAVVAFVVGPDDVSGAKCGNMKWTDQGHDDNKPSSKEGKKLIDSGADVCEVAKKCDHMEIDVKIDNKKNCMKQICIKMHLLKYKRN